MAFRNATSPASDSFESGHRLFFRALRRFLVAAPDIGTVSYTGTGNGQIGLIDTYPGAPAETWTVEFTNATNFTVTGSVSGAQAGGTVGTNYLAAGLIGFRINAGATPFVAGDRFTLPVTASPNSGADVWVENLYDHFATSGRLEWIGHGTGLAGADEIYVGMFESSTPASQQWQIGLHGFTGFISGQPFASQPGMSPDTKYVQLWNQGMEYWIAVNGRRFVFVAQVSTTYHAGYAGFFLPYTTPGEYPYPLFIGGETTTPVAYTSTAATFTHFIDQSFGSGANTAAYRRVDGVWQNLDGSNTNASMWPFASVGGARNWLQAMQTVAVGEYVLFPCIIIQRANASAPLDAEVLGELDGIFALTGFNNAAENVVTVGAVDHLVVQNIFRTGREHYWALRED